MDLRGWKWKSPWEKRNYLLYYILFYLIMLLQEYHTAADGAYRQELKNEIQDSTKLDSLSNYLPYDSKEDSDYKRASSFFPLRGKKFSSDDTIDHQLIIPYEEDDKRSQFFPLRGKKVPDDMKRASYFTLMRGRKDGGWIDDYDITDENPFKRASSFMPMRGKKKYEAISDYLTKAGTYSNSIDELLHPQHSNNYQSSAGKRMSFVPVRGKRSYKDSEQLSLKNNSEDNTVSNHLRQKRAVSFMPMRGRKNSDDEPGNIVTTFLEKKQYSFMPMRGRREGYLDEQAHDLDKKAQFMPMRGRREGYLDEQAHDLDKKAQFMPMRGRREGYLDEQAHDLDKKAQFMPMRGRREGYLDEKAHDLDKKAQFMPMRGRREDSDSFSTDFENESFLKRAQNFMPMRGRRTHVEDILDDNSPEVESKLIDDKRASSFMPMRGRRSLLEKNANSESNHYKRASSFTLMRGRRSTDDSENEISDDSLDRNTPVRVRRSVDEVELSPVDQLLADKKASSFMPMRGRRYFERNITVDPWRADQLMSLFNKKSSSFMPMRGRRYFERNITIDPWQADQLMSLFNKKSSSFMPMRGRRYFERNITVDPWQADLLMSVFNKKSSAFMPMRGRRLEDGNITVEPWPAEQLMSLFNKKSSAFMPMRGRRDNEDYPQQYSEETDYNGNAEKRGSYFMPMRGRRLESKETNSISPYPYYMAGIGSSLMYKPYSDMSYSLNTVEDASERRKKLKINWDAVKRAFHASRGKRSDFDLWIRDLMNKWHDKEIVQQYEDSHLKNSDRKDKTENYQERCNIWKMLTGKPDTDKISEFSDSIHLMNNLMDEYYWCQYNDPDKQEKDVKGELVRDKRSIIRPRLAIQPNRQYIALKRPMSFFATRGKRMDDSTIDKISKLH